MATSRIQLYIPTDLMIALADLSDQLGASRTVTVEVVLRTFIKSVAGRVIQIDPQTNTIRLVGPRKESVT